MNIPWLNSLPIAITVTDLTGRIIEMNDKSALTFANSGGYDLIGKDLNDCHSQRSQEIIASLLAENKTNAYTIEKNGIKKLIYQAPWHQDGKPAGLVEISIEIPWEMAHHIR